MYNNKRLALSIFWVLLGIVLIGLSVMGQHQVQMILSYLVCLMLVVYWIAYLICSRKY